jgi:hypothetical protein
VQNAILGSVGGAIAVTYVEWSGNSQQPAGRLDADRQRGGRRTISRMPSRPVRAFSASPADPGRDPFRRRTLRGNGFEGRRLVLDVSGDGADNNTSACNTAANPNCGVDIALGAGVNTINGLAILGEPVSWTTTRPMSRAARAGSRSQ